MTKSLTDKVAKVSLIASYEFISEHFGYNTEAYKTMMSNRCSGNGTGNQGIIFAAARL